jgi:hypothetical protein
MQMIAATPNNRKNSLLICINAQAEDKFIHSHMIVPRQYFSANQLLGVAF